MQVELTTNERRALEMMFRQGPVTQGQLADHLDVAQQSASRILARLGELGMISNGERVKNGGRGYPSTSFALLPDYCHSIGISVAPGSLTVLLADFAGRTLDATHYSEAITDIAATTQLIENSITKMTAVHPARTEMAGAGLAISGSFIRKGVFNTPYGMDEWAEVDLEALLSDKLELPVIADNDGNAAALAESLLGVGQRLANFAYLYIGAGVGGGIVLDHKLWRGRHGNAGEFAGGLQPTLDVFPSLEVMRTELAADNIAFSSVDEMLQNFDPTWNAIPRWIAKVSHSLSVIASNAGAILDLEAIVLGGRLPKTVAEATIPHIRFFDQHRRSVMRPVPLVMSAEGPPEAAAAGAAILPLQQGFHSFR